MKKTERKFKYSPEIRKMWRDNQRKVRANNKAKAAYKKLEANKP